MCLLRVLGEGVLCAVGPVLGLGWLQTLDAGRRTDLAVPSPDFDRERGIQRCGLSHLRERERESECVERGFVDWLSVV